MDFPKDVYKRQPQASCEHLIQIGKPCRDTQILLFIGTADFLQMGLSLIHILTSSDKWYGVTYKADKPVVMQAIAEKTAAGLYPAPLWK